MSRSTPFKGWIIRRGYQPVYVHFVGYDHARKRYLIERGAGFREHEIYRSEGDAIARIRRLLEARKLAQQRSAEQIALIEKELEKYAPS